MNISIEIVFWASIIGSLYSYFIYPSILMVLGTYRHGISTGASNNVSITLIITAHNEAHQIEEKLKNTLSIKYPAELLEIIVASDGSTDATDSIVGTYSEQGVRLLAVSDRKGKENAQLHAIREASGDVLVFSDVATIIPDDALKKLSVYFNDPIIGGVSSEDRVIDQDGKVEGEGAYVRYEMWVRRLESKVYSLVGLSGSFFACRKNVAMMWDISVPSDFNTALNCVRKGLVAVTAPDVLGYYKSISDSSKEYKRKYRTALRGMAALRARRDVLNPINNSLFAFEVFSHKLMRWLVPWFMVIGSLSNIYLVNVSPVYTLTLAIFILFYLLSMFGFLSKTLRKISIFGIPFFFIQVNLALMHAGLDALRGKKVTVWKPSTR